jgi:hypothetical protein
MRRAGTSMFSFVDSESYSLFTERSLRFGCWARAVLIRFEVRFVEEFAGAVIDYMTRHSLRREELCRNVECMVQALISAF